MRGKRRWEKKWHEMMWICTYSGSCNWSDTWSGLYKHFYTLYFSFTAVWCSKETVKWRNENLFYITQLFTPNGTLHKSRLGRINEKMFYISLPPLIYWNFLLFFLCMFGEKRANENKNSNSDINLQSNYSEHNYHHHHMNEVT